MISTDPGIWVAAFFTIAIFSYFIKSEQHVLFRFAQATVVGIALGYIISIVMVKNIDYMIITRILNGEISPVIPLILGVLLYARFVPEYSYLSRTPIAIIVAVGLGLGARTSLDAKIFRTLVATSGWLVVGSDPLTAINNIIMIIALIASTAYFFFTVKEEKVPGYSSLFKIGRYYLMIYFGASYGLTVLSRVTLLLGRVQFLLQDFLGL